MDILTGSDAAAVELAKAFGLETERLEGFEFSIYGRTTALLDATYYADRSNVPEIARIIKQYNLVPVGAPQPTIDYVRVFHEKYEHPIADKLTLATPELRMLRFNLILEELDELSGALGIDWDFKVNGHVTGNYELDIVEAADALGDIDYVVAGANLVFGIPAQAVMQEIQRANLSKLGEDGKPIKRADGKILKGPNYTPPDIRAVLLRECGEIPK